MYINSIGYYRREDCLKNNIKHEMQTREEDIRSYHNAIIHSLPHLPYDLTAIDLIIFMSDTGADEILCFIKKEFKSLNINILTALSDSTIINSIELINSYFLSKLSNKALLIYVAEEVVTCFFSNEKVAAKEGRVISISHAPIEHKRSRFLYMSYANSMLEMNGYFLSDLSYLIFNDSTDKVIRNAINSLNIPEDKVLVNTDKPISKPIDSFLALAQNYKNFKTNDLIYILVFRERILMGSFLLEIE